MSEIIGSKGFSISDALRRAAVIEVILLSVCLSIMYFVYDTPFGPVIVFLLMVALFVSVLVPSIATSYKETKHRTSLEGLRDIYNNVGPQDIRGQKLPDPKANLWVITCTLPFLALVFFMSLCEFPPSLRSFILLSIFLALSEFGSGVLAIYMFKPDKRGVGLLHSSSVEYTLSLAQIIQKTQDVDKIKVEVTRIEDLENISIDQPTLLFSHPRYERLNIRLLFGEYWDIGLAMDVKLSGIETSDEDYEKVVDIGLNFNPRVEFFEHEDGYKILIETAEGLWKITDEELKKLVDLLFSTIESNIGC